jgi:hypothetical protein
VVVDTEEEFDWSKPFDRTSNSIRHMREIGLVQAIFERHGVVPTYVVDYAVASQRDAWEPLKAFQTDGRADIGAHLQAWVSPPFIETVNSYNSYAGNIDPALEHEKLRVLRDTIANTFGHAPQVYRAGRYGLGPRSLGSIADLGFLVDSSPSPGYDLTHDGGPNYLGYAINPFWVGVRAGGLLCVPVTGGFTGWFPNRWHSYAETLLRRRGKVGNRLLGLLSRLGAHSRIRLSPEGHSLDELKQLSRLLVGLGVPLLGVSFHSPTVMVGGTPYSRTRAARDAFIARLDDYLAFAIHDLGAEPTTLVKYRAEALATQTAG